MDNNRKGSFSSSGISALMSKGKGAFTIDNVGATYHTYIDEKVMERDLGRSLNTENSARSTAWGTLVEEQAFDKMGLNYSLVSKERFYHSEYKDYWSGMPDIITDVEVGDIKSPWTLKSFCTLMKSLKDFDETGSIEMLKKNHHTYYWQLVSNAILCDKDKAILIVYVPYMEDLDDIRKLAEERIGEENNRYAFINWAIDDELPYLIKGEKYQDLNIMQFDIPKEDKILLTKRVKMGITEMKKFTI